MASDDEDWNEEESNEEESQSSGGSSEWDEDAEEVSLRGRTLLWLCQEGQIQYARRRFDSLLEAKKTDQLKREVFQAARDKNYPLHELLMGGTSDRNAYQLALQILDFCKGHPNEFRTMLITQPPSHKRTPLAWATWGNAKMEVLQPLALGNPEALVLKDTAGRTPAEILRYYFCSNRNNNNNNSNNQPPAINSNPQLTLLERLTKSWTQHRLRLAVHQCAVRYFVTDSLTPFDKAHRKDTKMSPKAWFVLSILGTLIQREMKPLLHRILQYTGGSAKIHSGKSKKKRAASQKSGDSGNKRQRRGGRAGSKSN